MAEPGEGERPESEGPADQPKGDDHSKTPPRPKHSALRPEILEDRNPPVEGLKSYSIAEAVEFDRHWQGVSLSFRTRAASGELAEWAYPTGITASANQPPMSYADSTMQSSLLALGSAPDPPEYEAVPGIPTPAEIGSDVAGLSPIDRVAFELLLRGMAVHLGSQAAARLWLKSPVPGFDGTPMEAIRAGQVQRVLAAQQEQWGVSPPYA